MRGAGIENWIANRGTTFNNYVDSDGRTGSHINFLKVYGRDGEKCKKMQKCNFEDETRR